MDFSIIVRIFRRVVRAAHNIVTGIKSPLLCWIWGVQGGEHVWFSGKTIIARNRGGYIKLGRNVVFRSCVMENLVGLTGPTILDAARGGAIEIGDNSGFSSVVISSKTCVKIGRRVLVGGNTRILDHDYHSTDYKIRQSARDMECEKTSPIVIEDDVFIGANCIVLKGSVIGARSIVAAGSVLFGLKVPSDSLVIGNPAFICRRQRI